MRITLRQLAVFEAVARHGSVSRGADEVALSQSAASMALKDLELGLGVSLFTRKGRQFKVNSNGRRLQPLVQSLMAQARDIEQLAGRRDLSGDLNIAATTTIADYVIGPLCAEFVQYHPDVRIKVLVTSSSDVLDAVDGMRCDIGFGETPTNRSTMEVEILTTDRLSIICGPSHPFADRGRMTLKEARGMRWCLRSLDSQIRKLLTTQLTDVQIQIALQIDSDEAIKRVVSESDLLGCMSMLAIGPELAAGRLVALDVEDLNLQHVFTMLMSRGTYKGELQRHFADFARDKINQLYNI